MTILGWNVSQGGRVVKQWVVQLLSQGASRVKTLAARLRSQGIHQLQQVVARLRSQDTSQLRQVVARLQSQGATQLQHVAARLRSPGAVRLAVYIAPVMIGVMVLGGVRAFSRPQPAPFTPVQSSGPSVPTTPLAPPTTPTRSSITKLNKTALRTMVHEQEQTIARLHADVTRLTDDLAQRQDAQTTLEAELLRLRAELSTVDTARDRLEQTFYSEVEQREAVVTHLREQYEAVMRAVEQGPPKRRLSKELIALRQQLEQQQQQLAQLTQARDALQAHATSLAAAKRALEMEVAFLLAQRKQDVARWQAEVARQREAVATLTAQTSIVTTEIERLRLRLEQSEALRQRLETDVVELRSKAALRP